MIDRLLVEVLKCGIPMLEFWEMTPREAMLAIGAANWRAEQKQRGWLWLAWHTAAQSRVKTLPSLASLLQPPETKKLEGAALENRRREFEEMKARFGGK